MPLLTGDTSLSEMLGRYLGDRHLVPLTTILEVPAFLKRQRPQAIIVNHSPGQSDEKWLDPLSDAMGENSVPVIHCAITQSKLGGALYWV